MCWNATVSLNTFLFSFFAVNFAYFNNIINIYECLFFYSFISMQLIEYFTWKHLHNKKINRLLSQLGFFLIFLQPILSILIPNNVKFNIKATLITLYLIFFFLIFFSIKNDFSMTKAPNGHLAWNWLKYPPLVVLLWITFLLVILLYAKKYILFAINALIFLAIYYTYYKTNTWGSLWCWIANGLAVLLIIRTFFKSSVPDYLVINPINK
uniref:Uncharacterized protein n=1 Tax=viral metagenome TaxID=1070528 RepID=A0A6C0D7N1_9ZZZZ